MHPQPKGRHDSQQAHHLPRRRRCAGRDHPAVAACGSGGKTSSTAVPTTNPAHPPPRSLLGACPVPTSRTHGMSAGRSTRPTSRRSASRGRCRSPPTAAFGAYATTPVVANGVLYTQDLASNVQAINLTSGKVIWTHKYNSPNEGPNGVTFANGNLYGATNRAAFALRRGDREAAVDQDTDPQRQRGHRHGPGIQRRHGLRVDRARQPEHVLRRQRPGGSLGDGCLDGGDQMEVRRGAREPLVLGAREHQLGRWAVESADVR